VGTRIHVLQEEMTRGRIEDILADNGFDGSLAEALDDSGSTSQSNEHTTPAKAPSAVAEAAPSLWLTATHTSGRY